MTLKHDIPANEGVANGIRRARQLTGFKWTPVASFPAGTAYNNMEKVRLRVPIRMDPYFPLTGMVYSSVQKKQKYIGFNVLFETFVTALSDPASVLYKFNVAGQERDNANCWYGIVCSCFASYVMNMKERWPCAFWPKVEGVSYIGKPDTDELQLLDIVLNTKKHIAVVTDILRDEKGKAALIEVSESTLPLASATYFTPEEFRGYWYARAFEIYRKSGLEKIPYEPSPFVHVEFDAERGIAPDPVLAEYVCNRDILPDQGNKANYMEKQELVFDILSEGFDRVEIENAEGKTADFGIEGNTVLIPADSEFHKPGFYKVRALGRDDRCSESCEYAITGLALTCCDGAGTSVDENNPAVVKAGSKVRISFAGAEADMPDMIYIYRTVNCGERCRFRVTEEDRKNGFTYITFPAKSEDTYYVFMTARNKYGEYTSEYLYFKTEL